MSSNFWKYVTLLLILASREYRSQIAYRNWFASGFGKGEDSLKSFDSSGVKGFVAESAYHFQTGEDALIYLVGVKCELGSEHDYLMRAGVKSLHKNGSYYGIAVGVKNARNGLFFGISNDGYYRIYLSEAGKVRVLSASSASSIKAKDFNDLMIIKSGNWMYFYINFVLHFSFPYPGPIGQSYTVFQLGSQHMLVDYLYMKERQDHLIKDSIAIAGNTTPGYTIRGNVRDLATGATVIARIKYKIGDHDNNWNFTPTKQDGSFEILLNERSPLTIMPRKKGYSGEIQTIGTKKIRAGATVNITLGLTPLRTGTRIVIQNLYFKESTPQLVETSQTGIERLYTLLTEHPIMKIEIGGHTSINKSPESYNVDLSLKRANVVKDYLVKRGIDAGRISIKGYGNSEPLDARTGEQFQKKNRRVEFKIVEM